MYRIDCPVLDAAVILDRERILSSHRTARGVVAYGRCVCEGLVVLSSDGQGGWEVVRHSGGSTLVAAQPARPAVAVANSA